MESQNRIMSEPWVHHLSPFLLEFSTIFGPSFEVFGRHFSLEGVGIRWYGLAYLFGFFFCYLYVLFLAKRGATKLKAEFAADFITYAAIGTLAGGRIGYVLFYSPDLITSFHSNFPYWGVLEVHNGGMASHGGIAGIAFGSYLFARKHNLMPSHLIDMLCASAPLSVFFGRIANFINGELYGRECAATFAWAVKFPREIYTWSMNEVEKLKALGPAVASLGEVTLPTGDKQIVTNEMWQEWLMGAPHLNFQNVSQLKYLIVVATEKGNMAVVNALGSALTPRYPSQLFQGLMEGLFVYLVLFWMMKEPRKPGVITATFGVLYATTRIIGEQFRMPDHDIGFQWLGLTRGQWLSIAMLMLFVTILIFVLRRRVTPLGGWGVKK